MVMKVWDDLDCPVVMTERELLNQNQTDISVFLKNHISIRKTLETVDRIKNGNANKRERQGRQYGAG